MNRSFFFDFTLSATYLVMWAARPDTNRSSRFQLITIHEKVRGFK